MALKMATPWLDPNSGVWYLRVRTPKTMLRIKGQSVTLSIGDQSVVVKIGALVKASLRTRDKREAKERFIAANAALQAYWQAVERGPQKLTPKQATALSADVYRLWADTFEDDPHSVELWQRILASNEDAEHGDYGRAKLMISPRNKKAYSMEARFGFMADMVLSRRGLIVDEDSRALVLREAMRSANQAARLILRRADGDYRADKDADRFPVLECPSPAHTGFTMSEMVAGWEKEALRLGRAPATVKSYRSVFSIFLKFMGHDDARAVTGEDLIRFKDKLFEDGIQAKTIKDRYLAAMKSVFGWAVENKRLPLNPVSDVKVRMAKRKVEREKGFTDAEALVILKASLAYRRTGRETTYVAAAKRWVPWLCAFTGARIADVTGLRKEDFRLDGQDPSVRIQDGKTGKYRDIPLHTQLRDIGFIEFVSQAVAGPLFYDKRTDEGQAPQSASKKIAKWVRELGIPDDVQPSHGWRHRFTTLGRHHGLDHEKREFILGHALPGLGDTYGDMAGLRREIEKLPYYGV